MSELVKYDAACRAIAEAASIDEAKDFRDKSEAMRAYARQAKNKQLEVQAAEIRIRAERRIGELMSAQRDAGMMNDGAKGTGSNQHEVRVAEKPAPPTLAEAGIDKNLADRARKYAAIPEAEFNGIVSDWKGRVEQENERVTVNLLAAASKAEAQDVATDVHEAPDPETAKARRSLTKLTTEALIDEVLGLREENAELRGKLKAIKAENETLKEDMAAFRQEDMGRALGNAQRLARAAEGRMKEFQTTAVRADRRVKLLEAEVKKLRGQLENQVIPL